MKDRKTLYDLKEGQGCTVIDILESSNMRRRLRDLGVINGTYVKCLQKSPFGDPVAYLIRGAAIALRTEDSQCILVS